MHRKSRPNHRLLAVPVQAPSKVFKNRIGLELSSIKKSQSHHDRPELGERTLWQRSNAQTFDSLEMFKIIGQKRQFVVERGGGD